MVSVPDWAKFAQLTNTKQSDKNSLLNKFYKQREAEALRQAEEFGYFLKPSEETLKVQCGPQNPDDSNVSDYRLVHLSGVHLRVVGDLGICTKLTICLLANNFLTKIEPLLACRNLIRLDLHSNQLSSIPKAPFWSNLRKLQMLHLHDNPLGKFETLQLLGSTPNLTILTLYDTPLSLKKNYRHHVVNSIWTLKALDTHVISDEEIIEDAVFGNLFSALSAPFRIDLCPQTPLDYTFQQEKRVMQAINARVNSILARHSPVLIVQRCLRGYLVRGKLGISKNRATTRTSQIMLPPPGTPIIPGDVAVEAQPMDYDTYLKHRRPGSIVTEDMQADAPSNGDQALKSREKQRLHVNLEKLESGTLYGLQAKNAAEQEAMVERDVMGLISSSRREKTGIKDKSKLQESKEEIPKAKRIKDIKSFFGPVVPTLPVSEEDEDSDCEIPMTDFRLKGTRPKFLVADATTEMILSRQEAGHMVREAEEDRVNREASKPKPKVTPFKFSTPDQRFFNRTQGTMGLSCLLAVHKAYKEREKAERSAAKMENILGMREERQRAKDRINIYHDERRAQVLKIRDLDRARTIDRMEKKELQRLNFLDKQQEQKMRASDCSKAVRTEHSFVLEFNTQHTSVSNALLRHDRQARSEDFKNTRQSQVLKAKTNELDQQTTVKKYLEHRQQMRQTETAMAKVALDTKMLTEANDRVMDARSRVAQMKAKRASVQTFYPLPPNVIPPTSTAPARMTRWNTGISGNEARLVRHHTVLT